ncbi:HdeD family acid-resistance protein [Tateyamaria sp.]|uniref:HdeD family acid-resistance protein n=1 Tax=Tateyamaria sp. TaxID=1929288 RepID=UPI00329BA099
MKLWVKWLILGVLSIAFGVFVLANPIAAGATLTMIIGFMFILMGVAQIYAGWQADDKSSRYMGIGLGILMLLLGVSFAFNPLQGLISLAMLVTILIGLNGVTRIMTGYQMKDTPMFWPMLLSGAVSILLAGYIIANFADVGPQLLGILLGIELLFNGAGLVALAVFLRSAKGAVKAKIEERFEK